MDKQGLADYVSILREIEENERRIGELQRRIDQMGPGTDAVSDTVSRGKRGKKNLGTVRVEGMADYRAINRKRTQLYRRKARKHKLLAKLNAQVADAEEYIDSLPDSELRRLLTFRCIDGMRSWADVAAAMGEGYTGDMCRMQFNRFIRK